MADKRKIKIEIDDSELKDYTAKEKQEFQRATDRAREEEKRKTTTLKAEFDKRYLNLKSALDKELQAKVQGDRLEVKEAIATRKQLEAELRKYTNAHKHELDVQYLNVKAKHEKEIALLKQTSTAPRTNLKGAIGSEAYVRQLQGAQKTMLPGSDEYKKTGVLIEGYTNKLKQANVEVRSFSDNVNKGVTGAFQNAFNAAQPYLASLVAITTAQKLWQLSLDSKKFEVLRANFEGTEADLERLRISSARTVSEESLIKLSNQAKDLGISLKNQVILFSLAENASDKYGGTVEENFLGLVNSTEGATRVLKTLGIQKEKYEKIVKELAAIEGDAIENLDPEIQKRIRLEAIIKATGVTYDQAIEKQQDAADMQEELNVSLGDLITKYGWATVKGIFPFIGGLEKSAGALLYAKNNINKLSGEVIDFNNWVGNALFGWLGFRDELQKPVTIDIDISALEDLQNRTNDIANNIIANYRLIYGENYKPQGDATAPTANLGTKSTKKTGSKTSGTKDKKEELNLLKLAEQQLVKLNEKLNANLDSEYARLKVLKEIAEVEMEIVFLKGQQALGSTQTAVFNGAERSRQTRSTRILDAGNISPNQRNIEEMERIDGLVNSMFNGFVGMNNFVSSMLQKTGLMDSDFGKIVQMIQSILGLGQDAFSFAGLLGDIIGFLPGGSAVSGVIGASGGGFRASNISNVPLGKTGQPNVNIVMENLLSGQTFLRKELPMYNYRAQRDIL